MEKSIISEAVPRAVLVQVSAFLARRIHVPFVCARVRWLPLVGERDGASRCDWAGPPAGTSCVGHWPRVDLVITPAKVTFCWRKRLTRPFPSKR